MYKGQTRFALVALPIGPLVLLSDQVVEMTIVQDVRLPFFLPGKNSMVEVDMSKCDMSSSEGLGFMYFSDFLIEITSLRWVTSL